MRCNIRPVARIYWLPGQCPYYPSMQTGKHTIALKKLSFDHLGNPGSFVGNPGSARVCPCLATGLYIEVIFIFLVFSTIILL
jgi:hypothetical protein